MEDRVSMDEIEAEDAVALPNKEVLSLLDVNANVDLGLDLAAPVDLAAAANLNVAAPIEAAATANVLSPGAEAVGLAQQHGTVDQGISGTAHANAPQHAGITQGTSSKSCPPESPWSCAPHSQYAIRLCSSLIGFVMSSVICDSAYGIAARVSCAVPTTTHRKL
ncbi:MAG: hypothetical protein WBQ18_18920, partial [Solirubrobacteraceae bacterium]